MQLYLGNCYALLHELVFRKMTVDFSKGSNCWESLAWISHQPGREEGAPYATTKKETGADIICSTRKVLRGYIVVGQLGNGRFVLTERIYHRLLIGLIAQCHGMSSFK